MGYRFKTKESIADGVRRIACEQLTKAIDELDDGRLGPHESIHQARKRCKKVRALLRLVRPALAGDTFAIENAWYRDAGREIAPIRDAATRIETVDGLRREYGRLVSEEVFGRARSALVARREQLLDDRGPLRDGLESAVERLEEGLLRVDRWRFRAPVAHGRNAASRGFDLVAGGLGRIHARARAAMRAAYDAPTPERFHAWRKRVKDHRYHVRLLTPIWKGPMHAREKELHALSDLLGEDHDLFVLESLASRDPNAVGGAEIARVLCVLVLGRRRELRAAASPLGARLFAEKSQRLVERYESWFDVWRNEASGRTWTSTN